MLRQQLTLDEEAQPFEEEHHNSALALEAVLLVADLERLFQVAAAYLDWLVGLEELRSQMVVLAADLVVCRKFQEGQRVW